MTVKLTKTWVFVILSKTGASEVLIYAHRYLPLVTFNIALFYQERWGHFKMVSIVELSMGR